LSELDAPVSNPNASRHAEGPLERTTEVTDAQVERRRKIFDNDLAVEVGIDISREPARLPRCETAARDLSWASVVGALCKPGIRMSVQ
jgi:hypothetical protein